MSRMYGDGPSLDLALPTCTDSPVVEVALVTVNVSGSDAEPDAFEPEGVNVATTWYVPAGTSAGNVRVAAPFDAGELPRSRLPAAKSTVPVAAAPRSSVTAAVRVCGDLVPKGCAVPVAESVVWDATRPAVMPTTTGSWSDAR